eukprot:COSAG02_NODE_4842_length_4916_cov_2.448204_4_plen_88_part_00
MTPGIRPLCPVSYVDTLAHPHGEGSAAIGILSDRGQTLGERPIRVTRMSQLAGDTPMGDFPAVRQLVAQAVILSSTIENETRVECAK